MRSKQLELIKSKAGQFMSHGGNMNVKREITMFITHKLLYIILQTQETT